MCVRECERTIFGRHWMLCYKWKPYSLQSMCDYLAAFSHKNTEGKEVSTPCKKFTLWRQSCQFVRIITRSSVQILFVHTVAMLRTMLAITTNYIMHRFSYQLGGSMSRVIATVEINSTCGFCIQGLQCKGEIWGTQIVWGINQLPTAATKCWECKHTWF